MLFFRLIPHVLAPGHPAYTARYMQQLLLTPPPFHIADHMRNLLRLLMTEQSDVSEDE